MTLLACCSEPQIDCFSISNLTTTTLIDSMPLWHCQTARLVRSMLHGFGPDDLTTNKILDNGKLRRHRRFNLLCAVCPVCEHDFKLTL
mmetsp:Transcript_23991/g.33307  ORF Transcript_23991/g.33307 Transcript_23991/m.33307 type:complete len:88 (+) Transcript_23991:168-431(+)